VGHGRRILADAPFRLESGRLRRGLGHCRVPRLAQHRSGQPAAGAADGALWAFRTFEPASRRRYVALGNPSAWGTSRACSSTGFRARAQASAVGVGIRAGVPDAREFALSPTSCRLAIRHMRRSSTGCWRLDPQAIACSRRKCRAFRERAGAGQPAGCAVSSAAGARADARLSHGHVACGASGSTSASA
jgi:hypothetical protein